MPPMTSSRPGARETASGTPRSNSASARNVWTNVSRSAAGCVIGLRSPGPRSLQPRPLGSTVDEAAGQQLLLQQRLDLASNVRVRVTDPGHVGLDVERCVERSAVRVAHEDAALLGD